MLPYALLDIERYPLVLAPSDHTGWFSGTSLVAVDPVSRETGVSVAYAAAALEHAFTQERFRITAALVNYDGTAEVRTYSGALASSGAGWFRHGDAPEIPDDSSADFRSMPKGRAARRAVLGRVEIDMDEQTWTQRVRAVQDAIRAGDVYVMNLTMRVSGHPRLSPVQAFAKLHQSPGGPMAAFFGSPNSSVVSVSPERFLGVTLGFDGHTRRAEVWPIKGTAPRGTDESQDAALASALAASEKERAEHVMVVDLERNDLGRVCQAGSITVDPLLEVFPTPYCHQMVSCVAGELRSDESFEAVLDATFPCGSVTGAPKIAAMRIIEALEAGPRGAYTGALIVATPGRLDSSVLIRSLEYRPDGTAVWGTGCGITVDSDPTAEWREARLKASPILD